jgi:hypothetical protein
LASTPIDAGTTAQQAAGKLDTLTDPTVSAGDLINSIAPVVSETMITGPTITAEQACGARIHCEANCVPEEYVTHVMEAIMTLEALDVFAQRKIYEDSEGRRPYESDDAPAAYELLRRLIDLTMGVWGDTPDLVGWPSGVVGIQKFSVAGDNVGLANLLEAFADLAVAVLASAMGRVRYMLGLSLTCDAMRLTSHNVTGLSVTKDFFFAPRTAIPFLFDILRIPWNSANNESTDALIVKNAATNMGAIKKMREGRRKMSLCEVLDMMRTSDDVAQDPVMQDHPSYDNSGKLPMATPQQWRRKYDQVGGIEQVTRTLFDTGGVLNAPGPVTNPAIDPNAMDIAKSAEIDAPETFGSTPSFMTNLS